MTELLLTSQLTALAQNVAYALPSKTCYVTFVGTAPTVSDDNSTYVALPASTIAAYRFIKSTAADTQVVLKPV